MLPFNKNTLAALSCKVPGNDDREVKVYDVQDGAVGVYSGRVISRVTDFSPLSDGLREFGTDEEIASYRIHPWFLKHETQALPHRVYLPQPVVANLYKPLKSWLGCRKKPKTKDEKEMAEAMVPYVHVTFKRASETTFQITLEAEGEGNLPALDLVLVLQIEDLAAYADREFSLNAVEVSDALTLFAKLKHEEGRIKLEYNEDPDEPIWLSTHAEGHDILVGLPFERER